jgi:voltage-gated potassium channel Kch
MNLLRSAGAEQAKLLILAIDDPEKAIEATKLVKNNFPHLRILARAFDRRHAYELCQAGVDYFERETFESALHLGQEVLQKLGFSQEKAIDLAHKFSAHDKKALHDSFEFFEKNEDQLYFYLKSQAELEQTMRSDEAGKQKSEI